MTGTGDTRRCPSGPYKWIPTAMTALSLACGFWVLVGLSAGVSRSGLAALLVLAATLDALDGLVARALNATSPFGANLDSFADLVAFGMAPGGLYYVALSDAGFSTVVAAQLAVLIPLGAALRLARFASDRGEGQGETRVFAGLPTTFVGVVFAGLLWSRPDLVGAPWLGLLGPFLAGAMVSRWPFIKFTVALRAQGKWWVLGWSLGLWWVLPSGALGPWVLIGALIYLGVGGAWGAVARRRGEGSGSGAVA